MSTKKNTGLIKESIQWRNDFYGTRTSIPCNFYLDLHVTGG